MEHDLFPQHQTQPQITSNTLLRRYLPMWSRWPPVPICTCAALARTNRSSQGNHLLPRVPSLDGRTGDWDPPPPMPSTNMRESSKEQDNTSTLHGEWQWERGRERSWEHGKGQQRENLNWMKQRHHVWLIIFNFSVSHITLSSSIHSYRRVPLVWCVMVGSTRVGARVPWMYTHFRDIKRKNRIAWAWAWRNMAWRTIHPCG